MNYWLFVPMIRSDHFKIYTQYDIMGNYMCMIVIRMIGVHNSNF